VDDIPVKVRVSIGTTALLGLRSLRLDAVPTTAYLMTYTEGGCVANCAFCSQARGSRSSRSQLSRVMWPEFPTDEVLEGLRREGGEVIERICIQVINYPGFLDDVISLIEGIRVVTSLPISVDTCPVPLEGFRRLREAGVERVSIPLDAATQELFDEVKGVGAEGPYRWGAHLEAIDAALYVFGEGNVMSNLIIGLGETEREAVELIQAMKDRGIAMVLYAFTPLPGTRFADRPQPPLESYRRSQLARYIITGGDACIGDLEFDGEGRIVGFGRGVDASLLIGEGLPLRTTGCPGCNRPYYNERPSGPFYNYPSELTADELKMEKERKLI